MTLLEATQLLRNTVGVIERNGYKVIGWTALTIEEVSHSNAGVVCVNCGSSNMKPSGTCFTCLDCGESSSCG